MKKLHVILTGLLIFQFCWIAPAFGIGIVNNSGSAPADSLSLPFFALDSAGNLATLATGDSAFLIVFYPNGAVAYKDSLAFNGTHITSTGVSGYTLYNWAEAVSDIDGTPDEGVYSYFVISKDNTGASLGTPFRGQFQLYEGDDFDVALDRLATIEDTTVGIIDSLQSQDDWLLARADSAKYMNVKSIGGQANTASPTSLNEAFDGDATGAGRIALTETVNDMADSAINEASIKSNSFATSKFAGSYLTAGLVDGTVREELWNVPFTDVAVNAGSMWDSLNNSSYVQGGAGLDSSSVASWVWNTPQVNHTFAGTFGKFLDAEISGLGSGSGAYSYEIVSYDSSTAQVIPGTNLAVRNINQSALIAVGQSDALGSAGFNLDADSFIVIASGPGYIFDAYDTIVVSGAGTDTVYGDQFDPGSPTAPALCRIYGYVYSVEANPEEGTGVRAFLPAGVVRSGNLVISPFSVSTTTDSTGYFFLDLIRSDSLEPAGSMYDIVVTRRDGTILHKRVTVPDSSSWLLDW